MMDKAISVYKDIPIINRYYFSLILICSMLAMTGLPVAYYFALIPSSIHQFWRPFTSAAFFGTPSMSMANSLYFLLNYGQQLEKLDGSGTYAYFLTIQIAILSVLGWLLGFPFISQSMITAIIYSCSRLSPMDRMYV